MNLPSLPEYNDIVQHPSTAFRDEELKTGEVAKSALGVPIALSGGFAITYKLQCRQRRLAVRCFHKEVTDLGMRYAAISGALSGISGSSFVEFQYQPEGMRYQGRWLPLVKMEWIEGKTLGDHLEAYHTHPSMIASLKSEFIQLDRKLRASTFAHGDIQNGNVIINQGLRLIDYDGLYVPGLPIGKGTEKGHVHFQHPTRNASDYGPEMDRFSFILLYLSFCVIEIRPDLFSRYYNGENVIFTGADLRNPTASPLFKELASLTTLANHVDAFARICLGATSAVPTLDDFIANRNIPSATVTIDQSREEGYVAPYPVVDGIDFAATVKLVGNRVEIIGRIHSVHGAKTKHGKSYIFLNFADWRTNAVKITIWEEGLKLLQARPNMSWIGTWISVTGLVETPYRSKKYRYTNVGITVTQQSQLQRIDEQQAKWRLGGFHRPHPEQSLIRSTNQTILHEVKQRSVIVSPATKSTTRNTDILRDIRDTPIATQSVVTNKPKARSGNGCLIMCAVVLGIAKVIDLIYSRSI